jgi:hypothetical protein
MSDEATLAVIAALEAEGVPYMVVGSLSSNLYGMPRSTHDADFVVQLEPAAVQRVLGRLGPELRLEPQATFETVTGTTRYQFEVVATGFKIELFLLTTDAFDQQRFARRQRVKLLGASSFAPTPEDVILQKLRWSRHGKRSKDTEDAQNVIAVQGAALDWDYIHAWADRHGTRALLDELRRSIPPDVQV